MQMRGVGGTRGRYCVRARSEAGGRLLIEQWTLCTIDDRGVADRSTCASSLEWRSTIQRRRPIFSCSYVVREAWQIDNKGRDSNLRDTRGFRLLFFPFMASLPDRTRSDFVALFDYGKWANNRVLHALKSAEPVPDRAVELFSHLLRSQDRWYGRVRDTEHAYLDIWVEEDLTACARRAEASARRWDGVIDGVTRDALDEPVAYENTKGISFETPLRDILTHVVNHGTHHRAQIALVLREAEIAPPPTDYIFYVRENDDSPDET